MARLRAIKKLGGSYFIQLRPSDLDDLKLKEGDIIDIDDIIRENGRKEVRE